MYILILYKFCFRTNGLNNGRLQYTSFLMTMERARRDAQSKISLTMLEYAGCFNDERYISMFQTYNGQNMYREVLPYVSTRLGHTVILARLRSADGWVKNVRIIR